MDKLFLDNAFDFLMKQGFQTDIGLSTEEIEQIEGFYGFRFSPDLKVFLQFALPISDGFPNWRKESVEKLRNRLEWPLDGICFDIENNQFWLHEWGEKPANLMDAFEIARYYVSKAPILIPIYSHRYIPNEPEMTGNPVYSVYQTDIIFYGNDLASYLNKEFGVPLPGWQRNTPKRIRFWGDLVS